MVIHLSRFASRLYVGIGLVGIVGAAMSGCGGNSSTSTTTPPAGLVSPGTTPFNNSRQSTAAACVANAHQSGRARWTILVYMNAANNLQSDSLFNVGQMASVGSDGTNVNIVLQWKQASNCPYFSSVNSCGNTSFVGTHRYYIKPHSAADVSAIQNGNTSSMEDTGERLADPSTNTLTDNGNPTSDMGSYLTLQNFVQWGEQAYPADHLALVVWDHGSGPLTVLNNSVSKATAASRAAALHRAVAAMNNGRQNGKSNVTRGVSQDCNTGNQIATPQLAVALTGLSQPLDAIIIDCSLQCGIEVNYEVRNVSRILVGSEESPPGAGYPYDTWLSDLKANGQNPCAVGNELIQDTLTEYANSGDTDITQAMIDLSQMGNVATALNALGGVLLNDVSTETTLLYNARFNAQYYDFPELKDLYDYADLLRSTSGVPLDLQTAATNLESSLVNTTNGAILASVHGSTGQSGSLGMYVYLPGPQEPSSVDLTTGYDPQYNSLAIASAAPNWPLFLQAQKQ